MQIETIRELVKREKNSMVEAFLKKTKRKSDYTSV